MQPVRLQFPADNRFQQRSIWCIDPAATGSLTVTPEILGHLVPSTPVLKTNIDFGGGERLTRFVEGSRFEVFTWNNEGADPGRPRRRAQPS